MTANKPATPLPWIDRESYVSGDSLIVAKMDRGSFETREQDCAYIVHAANSYPELVAALSQIATQPREGDIPQQVVRMQRIARALLAKLGEAA